MNKEQWIAYILTSLSVCSFMGLLTMLAMVKEPLSVMLNVEEGYLGNNES